MLAQRDGMQLTESERIRGAGDNSSMELVLIVAFTEVSTPENASSRSRPLNNPAVEWSGAYTAYG